MDGVISTGGTGVTGRDVTPEAFARVWDKDIPGFGELFRWLSYQSIGTSTIQSRACAGVARGTYLFALPGSTGAVQDRPDERRRGKEWFSMSTSRWSRYLDIKKAYSAITSFNFE